MGRSDSGYSISVTIANNTAVSSAADISKLAARGLSLTMPSAWTAADIGFQVAEGASEPASGSSEWKTLYKLNSAGTDYEPVKCPNPASYVNTVIEVPVQAWMIQNFSWLRLISRSTANFANTITQGGDRVITIGTLE